MRPAILLIAIAVVSAGILRAQNVEKAAAKEKERRAKTGGSAKSFTDDDLKGAASKRAREGTPSASGSPSASPSPGAGAAPAREKDSGTDARASEEAKKARGAVYKARLEVANQQVKRAEDELKAAQDVWDRATSHPTWYESDARETVAAALELARKHVEDARRVRDDIEDAARHEGIPPGYLR